MLGFNIGTAELAGLVPCEEDYAPRFFCVPLEHGLSSPRALAPVPQVHQQAGRLVKPWNCSVTQLTVSQSQYAIRALRQFPIMRRQHRG